MKTSLAALTAVLVCCSTAQQNTVPAAERPLGTIDTVLVIGNEKTKEYVILNEMTLKSGMVLTPEALEFDRSRIYSLGLFTRVDLYYDSLNTVRFLLVDVRERWYLVPFPLFGFRDGDTKRPYYGAGILHNNVGGRNQKLYAAATLGYDPSFNISFVDPLLDRTEHLYGGASLSYSRVRNKSEAEALLTGNYDTDQFSASATLGKRFSLYQTASVTVGFRAVTAPDFFPGRTVSTSGRDRFIVGSLSYTYDSRDLFEYASRGVMAGLSLTQNGFGEGSVGYTRYTADLRGYLPLPESFTLAARWYWTAVSGGEVPVYGRSYFGYGDRVRGYYHDVVEGDNLMLTAAELRFSLLAPRTLNVSGLPLPEAFTIWRFGVSLVLFADAGATWYRGETVGLQTMLAGTGGGIHFLLPYGVVARIEYARNNAHRSQWILALRGAI
jgi:outer membrane protein assembly factor BamA